MFFVERNAKYYVQFRAFVNTGYVSQGTKKGDYSVENGKTKVSFINSAVY